MPLKGECIKKQFTLIPLGIGETPTIDYADDVFQRCCFELPIVASTASTDTLKNDITSAIYGYSNLADAVEMKLLKEGSVVATLNNNTYGTLYDFGFHEDGGKKYIGYKVDWRLVLIAFGEGQYQIRFDITTIFASTVFDYWFTYCLKNYSVPIVDETVRLEFYHNGIIGNWKDDKDRRSFKGLDWYNSIRFPKAMIYNSRREFESEEIQYDNGFLQDVKLEQKPLYDLIVEPMTNELHNYVGCEVVTSDEIIVTDYNSRSPLRPFVNKELKFKGNYEPNWQGLANKSSVLLQFEQRYNNLRKRFC
jgi:hypothetical protein